MRTILVLFLIVSCTKKRDLTAEYKTLTQSFSDKNKQCIEHQSAVLDKAVAQKDQDSEDSSIIDFEKDEAKALKLILLSNVDLLTLEENLKERDFIVRNCAKDSSLKFEFKMCEYNFSLYFFVRGLAEGMTHHKWSPSTRKIALEKILETLQKVAQTPSVLLDKSMALENLKRLLDLKLIPQSFEPEIISLTNEVNKQLAEIKTLSHGKFSCERSLLVFEREKLIAKDTGLKLQVLLQKVKTSDK